VEPFFDPLAVELLCRAGDLDETPLSYWRWAQVNEYRINRVQKELQHLFNISRQWCIRFHRIYIPIIIDQALFFRAAQTGSHSKIINSHRWAYLKREWTASADPFVFNPAQHAPWCGRGWRALFPPCQRVRREQTMIAIGERVRLLLYHSDRDLQHVHLLRFFWARRHVQLPTFFIAGKHFRSISVGWSTLCVLPACCMFYRTALKKLNSHWPWWDLSIAWLWTLKNRSFKRSSVSVPLNRLLIETDTPYLHLKTAEGTQDEPAFLIATAAWCINLGKQTEDIGQITSEMQDRFMFGKELCDA